MLDLVKKAVLALLWQQALILGNSLFMSRILFCSLFHHLFQITLYFGLWDGLECGAIVDIKQLHVFLIQVPDIITLLDIAAHQQDQRNQNEGGDQAHHEQQLMGAFMLGLNLLHLLIDTAHLFQEPRFL